MPKSYRNNPRQITETRFAKLQESLKALGDLGGVVVNRRNDEIIGGNQRSKALNLDACKIELVLELPEPDHQGTVAHGFIIVPSGERYAYRLVDWDAETEARANVAANLLGGSWDWDILANSFDPALLLGLGFDAEIFESLKRDAGAIGELLASIQDAKPGLDDWAQALEKLPDHDREPFQQMTFVLHDSQAESVKDAIALAKKIGDFSGSENENSNGNALSFICEMFLTQNGNS